MSRVQRFESWRVGFEVEVLGFVILLAALKTSACRKPSTLNPLKNGTASSSEILQQEPYTWEISSLQRQRCCFRGWVQPHAVWRKSRPGECFPWQPFPGIMTFALELQEPPNVKKNTQHTNVSYSLWGIFSIGIRKV